MQTTRGLPPHNLTTRSIKPSFRWWRKWAEPPNKGEVTSTELSVEVIYSTGKLLKTGEPAGARTRDPRLKRAMLYQLSYRLTEERGGILPLTIGLCLARMSETSPVYLVCLVYLVIWFLWVRQQDKPDRPDEPDRPNRPNEQDRRLRRNSSLAAPAGGLEWVAQNNGFTALRSG